MEIPVATPKGLLADKGYDGDRFRESLLIRGILPIIPPRSNRKVPEHPDYRRYRDRNRVERMFASSSNSAVSQPATTRPSYPSRASSISPPLACG
jgi:IS5 family transposase